MSSGNGPDGKAMSVESGDMDGADQGSVNLVSGAVDFDHELDAYEPKKDHYNFYFTYKTVYPWWDEVALGMEDAQRQYMEKGITITYEYMAPEAASAEDQKKLLEAKERNFDVNTQLMVAKDSEKALAGWWRSLHLAGNLYLQRGANSVKANMDEREKQYEFWKESSVFTPT